MHIEPYRSDHLPAIVELSLRAWASVFDSIEKALDPEVYRHFYPDWRECQSKAVEAACTAEGAQVWTALEAGVPVGFAVVKLHADDRMGEVYMVAVDPEQQGRGTGAALMTHALAWMKERGMAVAMVDTGGDPGHAPARRTYEKLGFRLFPVARYFLKLG